MLYVRDMNPQTANAGSGENPKNSCAIPPSRTKMPMGLDPTVMAARTDIPSGATIEWDLRSLASVRSCTGT